MATRIIRGTNDLESVNPALAKEWHESNNGRLSPTMVTAGSSKKVWWHGVCGHEWQATIASRNHGVGCPFCAKMNMSEKLSHAAVLKSGSLAESNPALAAEWNTEKNGLLQPTSVTANSHKVVWWICTKNHEWQASVKSRNLGHDCPFCSGKRIIPGINDLVTTHPEIAREWDTAKNTLMPNQVSYGSNKLISWKCSQGHEWQASVKCRSRGSKCPVCFGRKTIPKENDLATRFSRLAAEWHPTKNGSIMPDSISPGSHTKVWWLCSNGHEWQASPNHRTSKTRNCPYCCHNPRVMPGENDLATRRPKLAAEWNYTRNGELTPESLTANSNRKVWWVCSKGHEWKTAVNHRANGSGCPFCSTAMQTSFPEQAIYYYVHMAYSDAKNGYTELFNNHGMELDIYIPSLKIGIEYDGAAFHRTRIQHDRELKKYRICHDNNVFLIRIKENIETTTESSCDVLLFAEKGMNDIINQLSGYIAGLKSIDYDAERDRETIQDSFMSALVNGSLSHIDPELAKEWNYARNALGPDVFMAGSCEKVWWICKKGHEWKATIDSRHGRGTNCPYCSNNKVLPGFNDMNTLRPDLMAEWHPTLNANLDPNTLRPGSGKKAWWICKHGHTWQAEISSRNKGHGCPYCAGIRKWSYNPSNY